MTRPERLLVYFALPVTACLMAAAIVSLFPAQRAVDRAMTGVEESLVLTQAVEVLLSSVKDAETAQRGFLLTQNDSYLSPYTDGIESANNAYARLAEGASPSGADHLARLRQTMNDKFSELQHTIDLAHSGSQAPAVDIVQAGAGQRLMASLRAEAAGLDAVETRVLLGKKDALETARSQVLVRSAIAAGGGFGMVASVVLFMFGRGRRNEARMRSAIDNMAEGFALLDKDYPYPGDEPRRAATGEPRALCHSRQDPLGSLPRHGRD